MSRKPLKPEWKAKIEEAIALYTVKRGEDECWLWEGPGGARHPMIYLKSSGIRHSINVCRYLLGVLTSPKRRHVFRICKNPICVNPAHLSLKRPMASRQIWKEDQLLMRLLQKKGRSVRDIARCWGVSHMTVQRYLKTDIAPEKPDGKHDSRKRSDDRSDGSPDLHPVSRGEA